MVGRAKPNACRSPTVYFNDLGPFQEGCHPPGSCSLHVRFEIAVERLGITHRLIDGADSHPAAALQERHDAVKALPGKKGPRLLLAQKEHDAAPVDPSHGEFCAAPWRGQTRASADVMTDGLLDGTSHGISQARYARRLVQKSEQPVRERASNSPGA